MENDERDRTDLPQPPDEPVTGDEGLDDGGAPTIGDEPSPASRDAEPSWTDASPGMTEREPAAGTDVDVSASEIESWPSEDAVMPSSEPPEPAATPDIEAGAVEAWPTEPPPAGSGGTETWPTTPPEMGGEPILEPGMDAAPAAPPPSEIEAYPAAPADDLSTAATAPDETPGGTPADAAGAASMAAAGPASMAAEAAATPGTSGESTLCPRCGTENQAGLSFCRNCGQRLVAAGVATTIERPAAPEGTMACPRCGTHNRAGVAFCQNCGANLRGTAAGYVPPAVAGAPVAAEAATARGGAVLGPVVLLIGIAGLVTAYLLPFAYGTGSLFERSFGTDGYGISFWSAAPDGGLADQAYFALAAASPVLSVLLAILAIAGFARARPGGAQTVGLAIALLWSVGLVVLFGVAELAANWSGDIVGMLRVLTPAGIIFFLSGLIVLIGTLTRFGRS